MNQERARRHDIAVYLILLLLAVIAAITGLLSLKENQSLQSLLLNISTELAGAALIFFILKYFAIDESATNSIERKLNKIVDDTELGTVNKHPFNKS